MEKRGQTAKGGRVIPMRKPSYHCPHVDRMNNLEARVQTLEGVYENVEDVKKIVVKIWRVIKFGAPSVITAAVTAGYINGDFATLLKAIFN